MQLDGQPRRTLWPAATHDALWVIDQRQLPHRLAMERLGSVEAVLVAIRDMWVRGAPLIGACAAYGLALQANVDAGDAALRCAAQRLGKARPTAVNLSWALQHMLQRLLPLPLPERAAAAWREAAALADADVATNQAIGRHGLQLLRALQPRRDGVLNLLTHCNAGWLATVDWGTALAPVYKAAAAGIEVHVLVDETRPRNQGASLTAWELAEAGIPHHLIVDNAGGHQMQRGLVDLCLVGTDRTTASGDVCNKIGTYLKALAAADNNVPFYVALPGSTIDWQVADGLATIPIEERGADEVLTVQGQDRDGQTRTVSIAPAATPALNPAFDVTPARLVTGLITERGVCPASREGLLGLYPEQRR